ncbi:MAG: hypothetical protein DHS20C01_13090 [marine bacterium B5-7]|nr:MAG: hypothetical protein DHS20C01_13090 [marine bacterium B5-7]
MPNTLIHLGAQGLSAKLVKHDIDMRFVFLACIIPDLPWVVQRFARQVFGDIDRMELMLRSGIQSSLFFCLIFSAAIAAISRKSMTVFIILASGSLIHLLLDATQKKWARGSFLLAPFDWHLTAFEWLWPENTIFPILTILSLIYIMLTWRSIRHDAVFAPPSIVRYITFAVLAIIYMAAPRMFIPALVEQNVYFSKTLSDFDARPGKHTVFDRAPIIDVSSPTPVIRIYTGESIRLANVKLSPGGAVSVKGVFIEPDLVRVDSIHEHPPFLRTLPSVVGLVLIALLWIQTFYIRIRATRRRS